MVSSPPADGVFGHQTEEPSDFNTPMPSALPPMDDLDGPNDVTGMMPSLGAVGGPSDIDLTDSAPPPGPGGGEFAPTDPFPEAPSGFPGSAGGSAAPETRSFDGQPMAAAGAIGGVAAMGAPTDARASARDVGAAGFGQGSERKGPQPRRTTGASAGAAGARPKRSGAADRLQDTEFKLADKRKKQKPKEPNKLVLGLAAALVVLAGVAVAYILTRGDDGANTDTAATDTTDEEVPEAAALEDASVPESTTSLPQVQVDEPTLIFEQAETGPLQQGETYSIDLLGAPPGAMLQVVVDDLPQGDPAAQLPDLILPSGRHSLYIQITNGPEQTVSTPVDVYVIGDPPPQGYRANVSSVDMQNEGWAEAIRQFDEFRAAGHEGLQLAPLVEGFWNIFVGGFGEERSAALTYCESFGLAVPDECFGAYYDGSQAPAPATTVAESTEDTETSTTAEAMEDSTTVTTAAGG